VPAVGLPQLQYLSMPYASLGYGDVFVAGVLGGILAARGERQWPAAMLVLALAAAWDLLFYVFDTLPATVPVAIATILCAVARRRWRAPAIRGDAAPTPAADSPAP
jgi:Na+/H+ antiporter NhaB